MKRRPVLFTSAAAVGLWSAWIVLHGDTRVVAAARTVTGTPATATRPAPPASAVAAQPVAAAAPASMPASGAGPGDAAARARLAEAAGDDAFAPREWVKPPPPPPPPPPPGPPTPPPPPPPPPPPTLPYRFVGMLDEGPAARPRVFLALGEKLLVAGVGDSLEGGFRLTAISAQELVFEHVQNRLTLKLAVAAGAS